MVPSLNLPLLFLTVAVHTLRVSYQMPGQTTLQTLLHAYYRSVYRYKCMRLLTRVYGIA